MFKLDFIFNRHTFVIILFMFISCSKSQDPLKDELIDFYPINVLGKERVAHMSNIYADSINEGDNRMWSTYQASEIDAVESAYGTSYPVLSMFSIANSFNIDRFKILEKGQTVNTFKVSNDFSPYEPSAIISDGRIRCFVICANQHDNFGLRYVYRDFNTAGRSFGDVKPVYIKYKVKGREVTDVMSKHAVENMINKLTSTEGNTIPEYLIFSGDFAYYNGYYYTFLGGYSSGFQGCMLRSKNGDIWEMMFFLPAHIGHVFEASFKIVAAKAYIVTRHQDSKKYTLMKIDLNTGILEKERVIKDCSPSRPHVYLKDDNPYIMYNGKEALINGVLRSRNRVVIEKIDHETLSSVKSWEIKTNYSFQYYSTAIHKNKMYVMWTNGFQRINTSQLRDAIVWKEFAHY